MHTSDPASTAQGRIGDSGSDAPVEARLGAHVFRFPANVYSDQRGPYPDGSVGLTLLWPDLAPAAPAQMPTRGDAAYDTRIQVGAIAVEGAAGNAALRRLIEPDPSEPEQRDDPARNLALRIEGEPVHGLSVYSIDAPAARAFLKRQYGERAAPALDEETFTDWYLARDATGNLTSVIVCDERQVADGLRIKDGIGLVRDDEATAIARCAHDFLVADGTVRIAAQYPRAMLKDWQRIETRVRELFDTHRAR